MSIYLLKKGRNFTIYNAIVISGSEIDTKFHPDKKWRCLNKKHAIAAIREMGGGTLLTQKEFKLL